MHEVERVDWTAEQRDLLLRIEEHPFERADHALDFTRRLARDRGWSLDFARGAVAEYRRFCFLAMVFDTPVTPSEEVDEVWHQHLTYSRDYWDVWCGRVLQQRLHHDPTEGGSAEQGRYRMQYAETLARYEAFFGAPDPLFWPATHQRFRNRPRYRIIDGDRVLTLRRPDLRGWFSRVGWSVCLALGGLSATPQPASALPLNPLDWTAAPFLTLYAGLAAAALLAALLVLGGLRRSVSRDVDLDLVELAYLAGGAKRAVDTVIVGLMDAGVATFSATTGMITMQDKGAALSPDWEPFRGLETGTVRRSAIVRALAPHLEGVHAKLVGAALLPSPQTRNRMSFATVMLVVPVLLLGIAKMIVGTARDKPIGFLIALTVATIVVAGVILAFRPKRTTAGDAALDRYRIRYERAARAPRDTELPFAFALGGAALLAGTPYEAYGRHSTAVSGSGSGCGSTGGDSGGGSGCGGGGCGGCGGGGGGD